jgi:SAM-dependent methyltransferase
VSFAALHDQVFDRLAGRHPQVNIAHHQYLATRDLTRDLREILPGLSGTVVDLGSRDKPYGPWLTGARTHIGTDVAAGPGVDVVIGTDERLPFGDGTVDAVLCTQVMEFVGDPDALVAEIARCLRPGGRLILTVPFTSNQHGEGESDLHRWSAAGARQLAGRWLEVDEVRKQGRVGSTLAPIGLNWIRVALSGRWRWLRGILLPFLLVLHAVVNALGSLVDQVDATGHFYGNVLVVAHRADR